MPGIERVTEGKVTVDEGARLLNALRNSRPTPRSPREGRPNWLRVRVTNMATGRTKVNVNLPFSLVKAGIKMGAHFSPAGQDLDWDEVLAAIQEGASGTIVEVEDEEDGEKVQVFVE